MKGQILLTVQGGIVRPDGSVEWGPLVRANSFVLNFLKWLAFCMGNIDTQPVNDLGNAGTPGRQAAVWEIYTANDRYRGIWIGTGTTAVARTQYALVTPITAGFTSYLSVVTLAEVGANTHRLTITRDIKNTSGSSWNLKEVCLYNVGYFAANWYAFMMERTLYNLTVANNNTCRYIYNLNVTLP
jgi:hypothetical protein